jgi:NADPH-dependent 2,4-dienoyl-CoA reductase/sulfur reductase-like enzyme
MSDDNFFRRIGIPASLAALVSAAVTMSFFMFQIDNRYAKSDDVAALNDRTVQKIDALTTEVSRLVGVTQVLAQVAGRMEATNTRVMPVSPPTPVADATVDISPSNVTTPPIVATERPAALQDVLESAPLPQVPDTPPNQPDVAALKETLRQTDDVLELSRRNLNTIQKF